MSADTQPPLAAITATLAERFRGVHTHGTVAHLVSDSYVAQGRTAFADPRLPELTERFAADRLTAPAPAAGSNRVPAVLFICIHNAGRSPMTAALMQHHAGAAVQAHSAGSQPADTVSKSAAAVPAERGLTLDDAYSTPITARSWRKPTWSSSPAAAKPSPCCPDRATRSGTYPTRPAATSMASAPSATRSTPGSRPCSASSPPTDRNHHE